MKGHIINYINFIMNDLFQTLNNLANWKQSLRRSCKRNGIKTCQANSFTPLKFQALYDRLLKIYQFNKEKAKTTWFENELRAYHWLLLVISQLHNTQIANFTSIQWQQLSQIFRGKQLYVLQYEAIRFNCKKEQMNRNWHQKQQGILKQIIMEQAGTNKWNDIARNLFQLSEGMYYRTGKQCRQRWLNHLDPNKIHGKWTIEQDKRIIQLILKNGKKWSQIAKQLGDSRTQHMVKNRFKSLIIKQKKLQPKTSNENLLLKSILDESSQKRQSEDQNIISSILDEGVSSFSQKNQQNKIQSQQQQNNSKENKPEYPSILQNIVQLKQQKIEKQQKHQKITKNERSQRDRLSPFYDYELIQKAGITVYQNNDVQTNKPQMMLISPYLHFPSPTIANYLSPSPNLPYHMNFSQSWNKFNVFLNHQQSSNDNVEDR